MAFRKIKDLAVATGKYTDRNGETKNRYENIGNVFEDDQGKPFLTIKATFNPAGIERQPGKDSIMVSMFDLKEDKPQRQEHPRQQDDDRVSREPPRQQSRQQQPTGHFDDDLPF